MTVNPEKWKIDRHIPLALILTIVIQTLVAVWAASNLWARVDNIERQMATFAPQSERLIRLEGKVESVKDSLAEIKELLRKPTSRQ